MELLESKEIIVNEINKLFTSYNLIVKENINSKSNLNNEIKRLNLFNEKLLQEISEKDKYLLLNDKKLHDYEQMINKIQEDAKKELDTNDRGNMIRILDKENHEKDVLIETLQKKINNLECKLQQLSDTNINLIINDNNDDNEEDKPTKEKEFSGWSPTSSDTPVYINEKKEDNMPKDLNKINEETNVEEKETNVEEKETNVEEEETNVEEEESDDGISVSIITHYKKEYYIIDGEEPVYIYAIDGDELGDKVGEIKGKKKIFY